MHDIHIIIMAGGVGSRFWPMSTSDYPKQFIDVMGVDRSLIQLTVDRLKPICPVENMWVVTNEKYIRIVKGKSPLARMAAYIIYYLCIRNQNSLIMETREYFEKVMQDYNQNRKYRSLRNYFREYVSS